MDQSTRLGKDEKKFVSLKEASEWGSQYLNRIVTISNISYLLQYGRIKKYHSACLPERERLPATLRRRHGSQSGDKQAGGNNGNTLINIEELKDYYDSFDREKQWKEKLGKDIDWHLSFVEYKESERTKHVHRLHPYKGKFIPQLVEYFLDSHTDEFKKEVYFRKGNIVLDPFCGSGTTLVQANELGMHAIGIDISSFNVMVSNVKTEKHKLPLLTEEIRKLTSTLRDFQKTKKNIIFEENLLSELAKFNSEYFPSPEYKRKVRKSEINEKEYAKEKEVKFLDIYNNLVKKHRIRIKQGKKGNFLDKWFLASVREEIDFLFQELKSVKNIQIKKVLAIILSRTVRSCRATTHADLGTLREPVTATYYCKKHGKICKPIFSISGWWQRYSIDTLNRLKEFEKIRTETFQICLTGDSRTIDIYKETKKKNPEFAETLSKQKISGIFSSPPYVGLIDYHEQHAYAYEIFGFKRKDEFEIGPLFKGQGKEARDSYIQGIAEVLKNSKRYLQNDYDIFLVANDKYDLYPKIAGLAEMNIVNQFKRPVLNRVEKDRSVYAESIFHLKEKCNGTYKRTNKKS